MGGGSWKSHDYVNYATHTSGTVSSVATKGMSSAAVYEALLDDTKSHAVLNADMKSAHDIFKETKVNQLLDPKDVAIRESRDSAEHPFSNAIIFALDVTGSMNFVSAQIAKVGLPKLMDAIYKRLPVPDPQVMFMGFDDIDQYVGGHFQVSQFESDIRIAEQLGMLWMENNGGGNDYESYALPWLFAAEHTSIDCWEKRKKKGYLFTCGDELPTPSLNREDVERVLGYKPQIKLDGQSLLAAAQEKYNVFHIVAEEGNYARGHKNQTRSAWEDLMGDNVLFLPDHTKLAELVVSTIQIAEGANADEVAKSWEDKKIVEVIKAATKKVKRIVEV